MIVLGAWCGTGGATNAEAGFATSPTPSWPDSSTVYCTDGTKRIPCPSEGEAAFGQDGDFVGTPAAYRVDDETTVTDLVTGLMWQRGYSCQSAYYGRSPLMLPGRSAVMDCASLNLAGHTDWRPPTVAELTSLLDYGSTQPLSLDAFPGTPLAPFATDLFFGPDTVPEETPSVSMADGSITGDVTNAYLRCVRGSSPPILPYVAKTEGQLSWLDALAYCDGLPAGANGKWRLPTAKEVSEWIPACAFSGGFTTIWTGTPSAEDPSSAYVFSCGSIRVGLCPYATAKVSLVTCIPGEAGTGGSGGSGGATGQAANGGMGQSGAGAGCGDHPYGGSGSQCDTTPGVQDMTVDASGWDAFEGMRVSLQGFTSFADSGDRATVVTSGSFTVDFGFVVPQDPTPGHVFYFDVDGDGACDATVDRVFESVWVGCAVLGGDFSAAEASPASSCSPVPSGHDIDIAGSGYDGCSKFVFVRLADAGATTATRIVQPSLDDQGAFHLTIEGVATAGQSYDVSVWYPVNDQWSLHNSVDFPPCSTPGTITFRTTVLAADGVTTVTLPASTPNDPTVCADFP